LKVAKTSSDIAACSSYKKNTTIKVLKIKIRYNLDEVLYSEETYLESPATGYNNANTFPEVHD